MRSRSYRSQGIVLRQYPLGEADRILSILTPGKGKVRAVAKGVRRPLSRLRGHVDLTNLIEFSAAYGRNLDIVTEAQARDDHPLVRSDLPRLSQALYACEIADSFAQEGVPSGDVFGLLVAVLDALGEIADPWLLARWYESRMLELTGFRPELQRCVECGKTLEPGDHLLDLAAGGALCPDCRNLGLGRKIMVSEAAMRVLRFLQRVKHVDAIGRPSIRTSVRTEVEATQARYLRSVLERDIKSADFARRASRP